MDERRVTDPKPPQTYEEILASNSYDDAEKEMIRLGHRIGVASQQDEIEELRDFRNTWLSVVPTIEKLRAETKRLTHLHDLDHKLADQRELERDNARAQLAEKEAEIERLKEHHAE